MVSSSPIRSSSPMSSTRPNPNPSNPERKGAGVRKSFNGYPLAKSSLVYQHKTLVPNTPVNSPAEYARGSDGRNPGMVSFRDQEQKENQSDLNVKPIVRAKSPSVCTKGATKHFMSPTISAASKISPSPRKKVLGERNEAIRTSASLSDGKFHFFSTNSLDFDDVLESEAVIPTSFNKASASEPDDQDFQHQNGSDFSRGEVKIEALDADLVVLSPEVLPIINTAKSSGSLPLSEMPKVMVEKSLPTLSEMSKVLVDKASLDAADQSLPPYDPKQNYLSPRPQFLHYNPNWRTDNYVGQGTNLEDDFTCESVSEIENSSEEVQSEDSLIDQEDVSSSSSSSSALGVSLSEPNPTKSLHLDEMIEAHPEPKRSRWFTSWKLVAVLLLVSLGLVSILLTSHPDIGNAIYGDEIISRMYDNPHTSALVEHLGVFTENAKLWSAICADYFSQILQNARGVDRFSSLAFVNLTAWQEEEDWGYYSVNKFEVASYFESVEEIQGHCELQIDQTISQNYEVKDESSAQMQSSYPTPEENNYSSIEGTNAVKLYDSQREEVKQGHEIEDAAVAQMQSYSTPEDNNDSSTEGADVVKLDDSQPEEMKQDHEIEDDASAQMQSYTNSDDSGGLTQEAELPKPVDSDDEASAQMPTYFIPEDSEISTEKDELVNAVKFTNEDNFLMENNDIVVMAEQALSGHSGDELENMVDEFKIGEHQSGVKEVPEAPEIQTEVLTTNKQSDEANTNGDGDMQPVEKDIIRSSGISQFFKSTEKNLNPIAAAAITLVMVSILAAFMYRMKPKKDSPQADQCIVEKEPSLDATPSSYSGPVEVDMVGESCPTEMSSFQNTADSDSKSKPMEGDDEVQNLRKSSKRNFKRESLASSSSEYSMDPSYGSFSTYSVIHPKRGDGEVVTPVRRSNRIRSKVTSP